MSEVQQEPMSELKAACYSFYDSWMGGKGIDPTGHRLFANILYDFVKIWQKDAVIEMSRGEIALELVNGLRESKGLPLVASFDGFLKPDIDAYMAEAQALAALCEGGKSVRVV